MAVPLGGGQAAILRRQLDGRKVDVDHLVGPIRQLDATTSVFELRRSQGRAYLDGIGQSLSLRLDDGATISVPIEKTKTITDDQRGVWLASGLLVGVASAVGLVALNHAGKSASACEFCYFFDAFAIVTALPVGTMVGALVGHHKSAQWHFSLSK
jgi:hypothetical protein